VEQWTFWGHDCLSFNMEVSFAGGLNTLFLTIIVSKKILLVKFVLSLANVANYFYTVPYAVLSWSRISSGVEGRSPLGNSIIQSKGMY